MLRRVEDDLLLTIPWEKEGNHYARWFGEGIRWGDDPDRTRFNYAPPKNLWFVNPDGWVALVDCHSRGRRATIPGSGEGRVGVDMAVMGARSGQDYRRLNGMQSVVPGLGLWLGHRSFERTATRDGDGWLSALTLEWTREAPIKASRKLNLTFQRGFEFRDIVPGDEALLEDQFYVQTLVAGSRSWHDHLRLHTAVRDLVALAGWQPFDVTQVSVMRGSDPARILDGRSHGRQWLPAQVFVHPRGAPTYQAPRFLFSLDDIGTAGVDRWLNLQRRHLRTVQPLVFSLRQQHVPLETHLLQIGAAVEALGFDLACEAGISRRAAASESFMDRAVRVTSSFGNDFPPFLTSSWPDDLRVAYRGVKHADRDLPSVERGFRLLQASRLILRLWIGKRLGANPARLWRRARHDHMGQSLA